MRVAIIGTGYVGLTTGACLAFVGHSVSCLDTDECKIKALLAGKIPIYEPKLEELLDEARHNLQFTTSYAEAIPGAEVVFIAVGTPPTPSGAPNLEFLSQAARGIGQHMNGDFTVVVNKSTVPIGSGNWVGSLIREACEQRQDGSAPEFAVASNPEFLREGTALHDSLYPDRIVIGADEPRALEVLYSLYRPILDQTFNPPTYLERPEDVGAVPLLSTDLASAELIKYAANAFLALKISFINEIGLLAERVGANISEVGRGIGLDSRIGPRFLSAGIGWGGSCFGKDTSALIATAGEYGLNLPIVEAARKINCRQRDRVVEKLLYELKILKGRMIGLLGLAFKPNTDDLREAPAIEIAQKLIDRGVRVKAHDPIALEKFRREHGTMGVQLSENVCEVAEGCDALVLVTEWNEYRDLDWEALAKKMRNPVILDGRHALDRDKLTRAGLRYVSIS
ncbi:MAG: UDP-glucose/GDP-mannose dehydrogenase family protein [Acidobacteriia bacterium]|nr:UDP-glucose/GDP-mannose dehydrogenase family protein [Terriglobia bacterium]MBV8830767.1 UDP-glucose/GDP-mannose dehydrogenase family protein [Acidobacteriaceae bacterium]MBV9767290.1 UDP-glucose/GDP-mannose dehydrogenase family protein [Acidobacteriaceae bacterium]